MTHSSRRGVLLLPLVCIVGWGGVFGLVFLLLAL